MAKITEIELAEQVIDWLESKGWDVYQEVQFRQGSKVADIVAIPQMPECEEPEDLWIIECKTSYGLAVLDQANRWDVSCRSVAVPFARHRARSWIGVARNYYKVGIIEIDNGRVEEILKPSENRWTVNSYQQKKYIKSLSELHKTYAKAGSKSGNHLTPYKKSMIAIKEFIKNNPGCSTKEIVDSLGKLHYSHETSAKGNLRTALMNYESDWCAVYGSPYERPTKFAINKLDEERIENDSNK